MYINTLKKSINFIFKKQIICEYYMSLTMLSLVDLDSKHYYKKNVLLLLKNVQI